MGRREQPAAARSAVKRRKCPQSSAAAGSPRTRRRPSATGATGDAGAWSVVVRMTIEE